MKVLLISPLAGIDPACGDLIYTQMLLEHPPEEVQYESYAQALERGTLKEHGVRSGLREAIQTKKGLFREIVLLIIIRAINLFRKKQLLFWEPFRFFSVKEDEYDVIHLHVFSARFFGLTCPLVVSNAAPQRYLYSEARNYSEKRTSRMERVEIALARVLGVNLNSYYLPQAARVIAFTQYLKNWYVDRKVLPAKAVDVVPIFLPKAPATQANPAPKRIGFIAKDFAAKGGATLLEAFDIVRTTQPDAELIIVGCPPQLEEAKLKSRGITWIPYIPREVLMSELLPSFDVFAYPTNFDGLPLVVLEAMSLGIPILTSDYQAMPEMVDYGKAGLVSPTGDAKALADNILKALEKDANAKYRELAHQRFNSYYSDEVNRPLLYASYKAAIDGGGRISTPDI